jgi:sialate O-acetylesterase
VYRRLLPTMIGGWRAAFSRSDLPFLIVQLPSYGEVSRTCGDSSWAELREAQALARKLPNVELAITLDLPASNDLHPRGKRPVAQRLAALARATVYGEKVDAFGPRMSAVTIDGPRVRVRFEHAEGLAKATTRALRGFQLAGANRVWHFSSARIDGTEVIVTSDDVSKPVAVRYGWGDRPEVDLIDGSGLPAEPFRSDDWPLSEAPTPPTTGGR